VDWLGVLDFTKALRNVRGDLIGDWYRDPWSWPEYDYLADDGWAMVARRASADGVRRVALADIPKENYSARPAVVMEPVDRLLFQALVDRLSKGLIGNLAPWVFGWRLPRDNQESGSYASNKTEWTQYQGALSRLVSLNSVGLKTDIVSCFASIPVPRVIDDIERQAGGQVAPRLINMLLGFDGIAGRRGLPQRSKASSALANMYLMRLDRVLRDYDEETGADPLSIFLNSGGVARWMDDIWVFGPDEGSLRSHQVDIQKAARDAGLELHLGKTEVLTEDALVTAALRAHHSAVDDALTDDEPNVVPLEELIDRITDAPETADRSSIHFALTRARNYHVTSRRDALIAAASRMPHGADHLARAFRDLHWWSDLQEWFLDYQKSPWAKFEWSVASLGAMFPSTGQVIPAVRDRFSEILAGRPSLPLLALTAQRLASWDADRARDVIHAILPRADHPHERRVLGLAAVAAREERDFIRSILKEYEENTVTLSLIEASDFRPLRLSPDFSADGSAGD
jgi:hypothetical protein